MSVKPIKKPAVTTEEDIPPNIQVRRELTRLKKEENLKVPNMALNIAMILGAEFSEMYETVTDAAKCCVDFATKLQASGYRATR